MNFPTFDGESTRLWISRAEYYFDTFTIDPALWVKLVGMHFTGAAARWIQSVDSKLKQLSWPLFCKLLHDRFGRDQHETLLRQMFHIHQTSTVVDYVDRFSALMDELAAYESNTDMLHYTTRFIDGLRDDIRSIITVQRPSNLNTVYSISLLQEEMVGSSHKTSTRYDTPNAGCQPFKSTLVTQRLTASEKPADKNTQTAVSSVDDKLIALKNYRHARGLCDRCAEKWTRGHQCSTTIQLHAMQEVLELFSVDTDVETDEMATSLLMLFQVPKVLSLFSCKDLFWEYQSLYWLILEAQPLS